MAKKDKCKPTSKAKDAKGKQDDAPGPSKKERKAQKLKRGKSSGYEDDLTTQLSALSLRVKKITADGNCFFRALSDQLQGDESRHSELRQQVVQFMVDHEPDFAPFVEDDQGFAQYISRMRREGVWAGHMELQAASLVLEANICIHQAGQPLWAIRNHPDSCPVLHLSYHDGEHYNSVRMAEDYGPGRPQLIVMNSSGPATSSSKERSWGDREEQMVMSNTGCDNLALVRKVLGEVRGSVDQAVERVIDILAAEEVQMEQPEQEQQQEEQQQQQEQQPVDTGQEAAAAVQQQEDLEVAGSSAADDQGTAASPKQGDSGRRSMHVKAGKAVKVKAKALGDGAPSRNKPCPCGSSQKYKNCCGAAAAAAARRKKAAGHGDSVAADMAAQQLQTICI